MGTFKSYVTARTFLGTVVEFDTSSVCLSRQLFRVFDPVTRLEYRVENLLFVPVQQTTRGGIGHRVIKLVFFGLATNALNVRNNNTSHKAEMGEALAGETPFLWGRFSPRQPRRFSLGYTNTLISDGAQSANSMLAKSSRQQPLFFTMCFWMKFRPPKLVSVIALTSIRVDYRTTNTTYL